MGVTLGRKIVKGGMAKDEKEGSYNVGSSLASRVKAFIGIAGGNLGLITCIESSLVPTCSNVDGFYPGLLPTSGPSKYLADLNANGGPEATSVYTIWSRFDDVIMGDCIVWGKITCRIHGQKDEIVKNTI